MAGIIRQIIGEITQSKAKGESLRTMIANRLLNQNAILKETPKTQSVRCKTKK